MARRNICLMDHPGPDHRGPGRSSPAVIQAASEVSRALTPQAAGLSAEIYRLILGQIPQLRDDRPVLALLEASVSENVVTLLDILQHGIDLEKVRAPVAAEEYARRLAQRDVPITALLRAYRIGSARFQDRCLAELGRRADEAPLVSAAGMRIADATAAYIDRISEELVAAFEAEKENWLRNVSAARAARVRALLSGDRGDVEASERVLGYRLGQHHVGLVGWTDRAAVQAGDAGGTLARLEHATAELARRAGGAGRPVFVPQDESSAWAWLPLGTSKAFTLPAEEGQPTGTTDGIRFAAGAVGAGLAGFRRSHRQALAAYTVAVVAGPSGPFLTAYRDIAPLALMSGSADLMRAWVIDTLGALARDDESGATLRDTLRVFLQENGSFKATAERLTLHKNTVQYRIRKARESLDQPLADNRLQVELALLASEWLGAAVLRPADGTRPSTH
jgi:PucR C-terminal helix-turn-helix domain/GGDEF-like domain